MELRNSRTLNQSEFSIERDLMSDDNKTTIIQQALLSNRAVIVGQEGISKSRTVAQIMYELTNSKSGIVIFAFKSYALAVEQRKNWMQMINCKPDEIIIVGGTQEHKDKLSCPDAPFTVPREAKFVFMTQAGVQRMNHVERLRILPGVNGEKRKLLHIIVDEFEYTCGMVPRLAYILLNAASSSKFVNRKVRDAFEWIRENFTEHDAYLSSREPKDSYSVAYWISGSPVPITFLTSEHLAVKFLELMGFEAYWLPHTDFYQQKIHLWSTPLITSHFFAKMNEVGHWHDVGFGYIITDSVKRHLDTLDEQSVNMTVVPHISCRGSNDGIGKRILTILSNIHPTGIAELEIAFRSVGGELTRSELEGTYYLDRLRQAIGRSVGFRGLYGEQTECWLWCHQGIYDKIKDLVDKDPKLLPFTIAPYVPALPFLPSVACYVNQRKAEVRQEQEARNSVNGVSVLTELDSLFVPKEGSTLSYEEIREQLDSSNVIGSRGRRLQVARVARYFGLKPSFTVDGDRNSRRKRRIVAGLTLKSSMPSIGKETV